MKIQDCKRAVVFLMSHLILVSALGQESIVPIAPRPSLTADQAQYLCQGVPIRSCFNNYIHYVDAAVECSEGSNGCSKCGGDTGVSSPIKASPVTGVNGLPSTYMPTSRPGVPKGLLSTTASVIDNVTFNYLYYATDFSSGGSNVWSRPVISRVMRSRDMADWGSFGPGFFCNYDLKLVAAYGGFQIFDPNRLYPGDYNSFTATDAAGNPVAPPQEYWEPWPTGTLLTLNLPTGGRFKFEVIQTNTYASEGRLVRMEDSDGHGTSLTYKSWTEQELNESPQRQWQIETVTGDNGVSLSFSYAPQQVGGRWAVSQIVVAGGGTIQYSYANGKLSSVQQLDGATSTFTWESPTAGTTQTTLFWYDRLTIFDPAAEGAHRRKEVYLTPHGTYYQQNGVLNQASQLVRMVSDGNDEVIYGATNQIPYMIIYEGAGSLKVVERASSVRHYKDGWAFVQNPPDEMYGEFGVSMANLVLDQGLRYQNTSYPNSMEGKPNVIIDEQGVSKTLQYAGSEISKITYGDGTFETWAYNARNQVTRHRDRLGNVTKNTYDAAGHLITKEVGILEVTTTTTTGGGGEDPYGSGGDPYGGMYSGGMYPGGMPGY